MKNIKYLIKYATEHIKSLLIVFVALISVSASLLSMGIVLRKLIDTGVSANNVLEINNAIFIIISLIVIFAVGSFSRSYFINAITVKIISNLKIDTYSSLLTINIVDYEDLKVGDIISRLGADIEAIGGLIINFLSFCVRNIIMLCGAVVLMFVQSPKLSLLIVISIPILLYPLLKLSKHVRALSRSVMSEQGLLAADIDESFSGIRTVYAYNQQEHLINKFSHKMSLYIKLASTRFRLRAIFFAMAIIVIAGAIITVIWIGSIDILKGNISSGQMISFIYYAIIAGMSAGGIAELFSEIQAPLAALDRVIELKKISTALSVDNEYEQLAQNLDIKFDKLSFVYPSRPDTPVLDNISLNIKQGKFTAIVGASGSGKSTLFQLLLKFYSYNEGCITIGGIDINKLDNHELRKKMAYVEQYPMIFSGTIKENIIFSRPDASDQEVDQVVELCRVNDFTDQLKLGLETKIGERGVRISGGQKQRIAIARAILYKPEILLLDEATSALDTNNEELILNNIRKFLQGKTIISIAHRISSIENSDEIMVIDHGKLSSSGTHNNLLESSKQYNSLYKSQEK